MNVHWCPNITVQKMSFLRLNFLSNKVTIEVTVRFLVFVFSHIFSIISPICIQKYFQEKQEAKFWYRQFFGQLESV